MFERRSCSSTDMRHALARLEPYTSIYQFNTPISLGHYQTLEVAAHIPWPKCLKSLRSHGMQIAKVAKVTTI